MVASIDRAQESLALLDRADLRAEWRGALGKLVEREAIHGLVRGRACRLLLEEGAIDGAEVQRLARLALSPATPTPNAAAWIAGVVRGSALLLLQQDGLWSALDAWLRELSPDAFTEALPLVRRAFADFQPPERRAMGDKVKRLGRDGALSVSVADDEAMAGIDRARADLVLPVLAQILGVEWLGGFVKRPRRAATASQGHQGGSRTAPTREDERRNHDANRRTGTPAPLAADPRRRGG
jgi:hypothetical protein